MKFIFFIPLFFLLVNCSKPKTVLICGDHVCVNKTEAEQYFEENLTIEVKIVDKKEKERIDLIELNLKENNNGIKRISIASKNSTDEELKVLSNKEIVKIKKKIKKKKKDQKIVKKNIKIEKNINKKKININKKDKEFVDICTIIDKCSIDEISKYLLEQGRKKGYPNLTTRQ